MEFLKVLMLGQSTAGAGREFHNVAELTNKELYKEAVLAKEGSIVYNDTHVN